MLTSSAACAQPEPPEPDPIDPGLVLDLLGEAYAAEPVTDQLLVTLSLPGRPTRRGRLIVRIEPGVLGSPMPRRIALELGNLRIDATATRIIAALSENESECVVQELAEGESFGEAISRMLPPLPIPHLDLLGLSGTAQTLTPYVTGATWTEGTSSPDLLVPVFELFGDAQTGPISLRVDASTGRLMEFKATLIGSDPEGIDGELVVEIMPAGPDETIDWILDTKGRNQLPSIRLLGGKISQLTQGQRLPDIRLHRHDLEPWSLAETMVRRADAEFIVFVLFRLGDGPEIDQLNLDGAIAGLKAVRRVIKSVVIEPVAVISLAELQEDRLGDIGGYWAAAAAEVEEERAADPEAVLYGTAPARLIEPFVPGAGALMVVVDRQRSLAAAINLTGRGGQEIQIEAELREALAKASSDGQIQDGG